MSGNGRKWYSVSFAAPTEFSEALEFAVSGMDALGSEVGLVSPVADVPIEMTVYFERPPDLAAVSAKLADAARIHGLDPGSISNVTMSTVEDQDWLAEWKRHWKPVRVGTLIVAAPWHEVADENCVIVRIEPNMAFGTGTHETTRSCLKALERTIFDGCSILDVGTGTGILAISAALLVPRTGRIVGCDIDAEALEIARINAQANGVSDRVELVEGTLNDVDEKFDIVVANLTADVIVPIIDELLAKANRILILAGVLVEQEGSVLDLLDVDTAYTVERDGEWTSIVIMK